MAKIDRENFINNEHTNTAFAIEKARIPGGFNAKFPLSQVGEECERKLWYSFHWVSSSTFSPLSQRIMFLGSNFEAQAIKDLKRAGVEVFKKNEEGKIEELTGEIGEKQEVLIGQTGHEKGKPDGRCMGVKEAPKTEHLLEIKTMKQEKWNTLAKQGVFEAEFNYYCQMQFYMKLMKLTYALFLCVNRNTGKYHIERVPYDPSFSKDLQRKVVNVIATDEPPVRTFVKGFYKCLYCNHKKVCESEGEPLENCRTCDHSEMENGGIWVCNKYKKEIDYFEQKAGCKKYKKGWGLSV